MSYLFFLSIIFLVFWMSNSMMVQLFSFLFFTVLNCLLISDQFMCIMTPYIILLSIVSGLIVILSFVMMMYPSSITSLYIDFNLFSLVVLSQFLYLSWDKRMYIDDHFFIIDQLSQSMSFMYSVFLFLFIFFISLMFFILFINDCILGMYQGGSSLFNKKEVKWKVMLMAVLLNHE